MERIREEFFIGQRANRLGGVFGSAFYSASYSGQKHIVELFLRKKREMKGKY